jgi:thioredoxin 1
METFKIILVTLFSLFILFLLYQRFKMRNLPSTIENEDILNLTYENFEQLTKDKIVLVDFWAGWCLPCRMMIPILNELASELTDNRFVGKINVEEQELLASRFGVRSIPTLIIFKNGVEVKRLVGVNQKELLLKEILSISE